MEIYTFDDVLQANKPGCYHIECKPAVADLLEHKLIQHYACIGLISKADHVYISMNVKSYLNLFANLVQQLSRYDYAINVMQLNDLLKTKLKNLTASQLYRVITAREIIKQKRVLLMKEPLADLNNDDVRIMLNWMERLSEEDHILLTTSQSLHDICLLPGNRYHADEKLVLHKMHDLKQQEEISSPLKIAARMNDTILLFHPNEIDYFESLEGKTYVNVRSSRFLCSMTMDEADQKLKRFGFYRSHRSYLVNMQKVVEIFKWTRNSYSLKLEGLEAIRIPLSKGRADEMKERFDI